MKKNVLLFGLLGGVLIALLRFVEYRFLVLEPSLEIYGVIVVALFAALGIWLGRTLTKARVTVVVRGVPVEVQVEVGTVSGSRHRLDCSTNSRPSAELRPFSARKRLGLSPERMIDCVSPQNHPFG